jgi:hypothetical protein
MLPAKGAARRGEIEMPAEIDIQFHADMIRDDGFTVIERAAEPSWLRD